LFDLNYVKYSLKCNTGNRNSFCMYHVWYLCIVIYGKDKCCAIPDSDLNKIVHNAKISRGIGVKCFGMDLKHSSVIWRLVMGWTTEGSEFESRWGQEFCPLQVVQACSGVHPTSYPVGTRGSFLGSKAAGA
jgi:hypothetical protein